MSNTEPQVKHYALVVNGTVQEIMTVSTEPGWNKFHELYSAQPVIISVPDSLENFGVGYTWDGSQFNPPA